MRYMVTSVVLLGFVFILGVLTGAVVTQNTQSTRPQVTLVDLPSVTKRLDQMRTKRDEALRDAKTSETKYNLCRFRISRGVKFENGDCICMKPDIEPRGCTFVGDQQVKTQDPPEWNISWSVRTKEGYTKRLFYCADVDTAHWVF